MSEIRVHADQEFEDVVEVSVTGRALLDDPVLNKGSAFPEDERSELGLLGLLPPHVSTVDEQLARTYGNYERKANDIERYIFLLSLQDRNETLFYRLVQVAYLRDGTGDLHAGRWRGLRAVQPHLSKATGRLHLLP